MPVPFLDSIDLTTNEIQNASFQKLAADPASPAQGRFWYHTGDDHLIVRNASARRIVPFATIVNPSALTVGGTVAIGSSGDASRSDHVHAMPGLATTSTDGFLSATFWNRLNDATASPTAGKLILRDVSGRAQVADPVAGQDIATYSWAVQQIALAKQGLAWKLPVRTIYTTNLAGAYAAGTKRLTASANGVFPTNDGVASFAIGDRVALNGQTTGTQKGLFVLIDVGSAGTPWILERSSDFGGPGSVAGDIYAGAFFIVKEGAEYGDTSWVCSNDTVTIDTTAITFQQDVKAAVDNTTIEVNSSGNMQVKDGGISYAKIQSMAACSILGRSANSSGVPAAIAAAANNTVLSREGDVLAFTDVSNAMLAPMSARTVKVNATNASAVPTDLQAASASQILMANAAGTGLEFSTVRTAGINDGAVTYAKIQNVAAQYRVLGRISTGAGVVEALTPANLRTLLVSDISTDKQAVKKFTIGDGTSTTITITHNFGTQNIVDVSFKRISDQARVYVGWTSPTTNTVIATFGSAPAASSIEAYIHFIPV